MAGARQHWEGSGVTMETSFGLCGPYSGSSHAWSPNLYFIKILICSNYSEAAASVIDFHVKEHSFPAFPGQSVIVPIQKQVHRYFHRHLPKPEVKVLFPVLQGISTADVCCPAGTLGEAAVTVAFIRAFLLQERRYSKVRWLYFFQQNIYYTNARNNTGTYSLTTAGFRVI